MKTKQVLTAAALAGILTMAASSARADHQHPAGSTEPMETEKCYGVAKAGMNDCGTPTHACAGHAENAVDSDKNEWIMVPTGLCEKLVNGSLTAPAAAAPVKPVDAKPSDAKPAQNPAKEEPAKKE